MYFRETELSERREAFKDMTMVHTEQQEEILEQIRELQSRLRELKWAGTLVVFLFQHTYKQNVWNKCIKMCSKLNVDAF